MLFSFGIEHSGEGSDELHCPQMNMIPHESKFFGGHGCSYMSYLYLDIQSTKYKYGGYIYLMRAARGVSVTPKVGSKSNPSSCLDLRILNPMGLLLDY